jgi:hypothetical protein
MAMTRAGWMMAATALVVLPSGRAQAGKVTQMSAPVMSCAGATQTSATLQVCAGATGAGGGFSVQWMSAADFAANGNAWYRSDDPRLCKASFSGTASLSRYKLSPGQCVTVSPGELLFDSGTSASCPNPLLEETEYVFRSFAHAKCTLRRSDFTPDLSCSTLPSGHAAGCTRPVTEWAFANPVACSGDKDPQHCMAWPVSSLTLGGVSYSVEQLVAILRTPDSGNGLVALAQQVIATRLSIAAGADGSAVADTIAAADVLMAGLIVPPVGQGFLDPVVTAPHVAALTSFNEGATGPGRCEPLDPGGDG